MNDAPPVESAATLDVLDATGSTVDFRITIDHDALACSVRGRATSTATAPEFPKYYRLSDTEIACPFGDDETASVTTVNLQFRSAEHNTIGVFLYWDTEPTTMLSCEGMLEGGPLSFSDE